MQETTTTTETTIGGAIELPTPSTWLKLPSRVYVNMARANLVYPATGDSGLEILRVLFAGDDVSTPFSSRADGDAILAYLDDVSS